MQMRIRCECGNEIVSEDIEELIARARRHAAEAHQMEIPAARILERAEPVPQVAGTPPGESPPKTQGGAR
jgi:uncharacterized protein DUF1059